MTGFHVRIVRLHSGAVTTASMPHSPAPKQGHPNPGALGFVTGGVVTFSAIDLPALQVTSSKLETFDMQNAPSYHQLS